MSFLGMIALVIVALLVILVYYIVSGVKQKNWKRIIFPILGFGLTVGIIYYGIISFITSM